MRTFAVIVIAMLAAAAQSLTYTHHSFATFDHNKKVVLVGVVKDFQ